MKFWILFVATILALILGFGLMIWAATWAVWALPGWARIILLAVVSAFAVERLARWVCAPLFEDEEFDIEEADYEEE